MESFSDSPEQETQAVNSSIFSTEPEVQDAGLFDSSSESGGEDVNLFDVSPEQKVQTASASSEISESTDQVESQVLDGDAAPDFWGSGAYSYSVVGGGTAYDGWAEPVQVVNFAAAGLDDEEPEQGTGSDGGVHMPQGYCCGDAAKPASAVDVDRMFGYQSTDDKIEKLRNFMGSFMTQNMPRPAQVAAGANQKEDTGIPFVRDKVSLGDKAVPVQMAQLNVEWEGYFDGEDLLENMKQLRRLVTDGVEESFGGFGRVHTVIVSDNRLIINGVCYCPVVDTVAVKFPLDVGSYLASGCIAPFFDWSRLKGMKQLCRLSFDDVDFVTTYVADAVGLGRRIGVYSFFRVCKKLTDLYIGSEHITRDGVNKPESAGMKAAVAKSKRKQDILDGFRFNFCENASRAQSYFFNSLKNYASTCGDRGLLRQIGGTVTRGAATVAATAVNFGVHFISGVVKRVKEAFTPITDEEAGLK